MSKRTTLGLSIALAILVSLSFRAPQTSALTLIPPSFEDTATPGETISMTVKLFNETAESLELYSSTANFGAKDETGVPSFQPEIEKIGLASWITVTPGPFALQPGGRVEVPVEIKVPADAPPGGHFAGVLFSSQPPQPEAAGSVISVSAKLGMLVLLRVEGNINEAAAIAEFRTKDNKMTYTRPPVEFVVRVRNQGNVHVRPTGNVTIRNVLGGTTTAISVNPKLNAVLPSSIRRFNDEKDVAWEKALDAAGAVKEISSKGLGNFFQEVGREWKYFALGPYTASLSLTYGRANNKLITAETTFWVFPWHILLVSLIVLILVILLLVWLIKRYNRWIVAQAQQKKQAAAQPDEKKKQ